MHLKLRQRRRNRSRKPSPIIVRLSSERSAVVCAKISVKLLRIFSPFRHSRSQRRYAQSQQQQLQCTRPVASSQPWATRSKTDAIPAAVATHQLTVLARFSCRVNSNFASVVRRLDPPFPSTASRPGQGHTATDAVEGCATVSCSACWL